jgi:hypothetical protein
VLINVVGDNLLNYIVDVNNVILSLIELRVKCVNEVVCDVLNYIVDVNNLILIELKS